MGLDFVLAIRSSFCQQANLPACPSPATQSIVLCRLCIRHRVWCTEYMLIDFISRSSFSREIAGTAGSCALSPLQGRVMGRLPAVSRSPTVPQSHRTSKTRQGQ